MICKKCLIDKELNSDNFQKDITKKTGFRSGCKICCNMATKKYREKNPERIKKLKKAHSKTDKGKLSKSNRDHRRRQLEKNIDNTVTQTALDDMLLSQGCLCNICEKNISSRSDRHLDHVYPLSKGGLHTISNLQWLCVSCNLKKGNKII